MIDTCPACQQSSKLGFFKATMSPIVTVPCESCGAELTVTWSQYLLSALIPSILFIAAFFFLEESSAIQYSAFVVAIILMILSQLFMMRLSVKQVAEPADQHTP